MIDAYIKLMRLLALSALDAPEPQFTRAFSSPLAGRSVRSIEIRTAGLRYPFGRDGWRRQKNRDS